MNRRVVRRSSTMLFSAFIILSACAGGPYQQGVNHLKKSEFDQAIGLLQQAEVEKPQDERIKRDLGVAYYKVRRFDEAIEKLQQADTLHAGDGKTIFYLGLAYEKQGTLDKAIDAYKSYVKLSRSKDFRLGISIRIKQLTHQQVRQAVAEALAQEQSIQVDAIPTNSVAVLYFQNLSSSPELDPLKKGLSQMLITDLAKAKQLTVVERLRLQTLLQELKLGTTGMVEAGSAPRVGKLIGAGKLVHGGFTDLQDENLRIDASLAEAASNERSDLEEITGKLNSIFQLEKDLAFKIIDELGVTLTQEEREAIQKIETESLLALIAYSRGLDFEDRAMFSEAKTEYQKAVQIDPGFGLAKQSLTDVDIAQKAAAAPATSTSELETEFESEAGDASGSAKASRLVNSSFAAQTGQVPQGDNDTREPLQEATGSDNATLNNAVVPIRVPLPPSN